jgi:hypothetical protein
MSLSKERIKFLIEAFISKKATVDEERELLDWVHEAQEDSGLRDFMEGLWNEYKPGTEFSYVKWDKMFDSVVQSDKVISIAPDAKIKKSFQLKRIAVAAAVVLLLVSGYLLLVGIPRSARNDKTVKTTNSVPHDVAAPNVARATLKLDDGKIIYLDSVKNGSIAEQENVIVTKTSDGKIVYRQIASAAPRNDEVKYHTISNPRGSTVQTVTLIDGTQVWLNAESSITYPTAFVGGERKVEITGEADFIVQHNEKMPFKVIANGVEVRDIGTEFNVNAYNDEDALRVTLLEGLVEVKNQNAKIKIIPGQQVYTVSSGQLAVNKNVNVEQVMAWKNGYFQMNGTDFGALMRQISRWYDVDVSYEGAIPQKSFGGSINRDVNLSDVLKALAQYGIHARLEERKVIVGQ